jgi:hypothetical protein
MEILGLTQESMNEKYLGLPAYMGRSKSSLFAYLKERVWKRIHGWKENIKGWEGNIDQGSSTSNSILCHVLL